MFLTAVFQIYESLPEILIAGGSVVVSLVVYFLKKRKK